MTGLIGKMTGKSTFEVSPIESFYNYCGKSRDKDNTLVIMKKERLWGVDIEFKMSMRKVKSLLKQTTPLQICTAPFLNSPEFGVFSLLRS